MSSITERSISRLLTSTNGVIPTHIYIKSNRSVASDLIHTFMITPRVVPSSSTRTPLVNFPLFQKELGRIKCSSVRNCRRTVETLRVPKFLWDTDYCLGGEVSDIGWFELLFRLRRM